MTKGPNVRGESVLVAGLGNPILGDDGVGWRVAHEVEDRTASITRVEVDYLAVGGLSLMERMLEYDRVILVDAIVTGRRPIGTVRTLGLEALAPECQGHTASPHDAALHTALEAASSLGQRVPQRVDIVAIETATCREFTDTLSPAVEAAVPLATRRVMELLRT